MVKECDIDSVAELFDEKVYRLQVFGAVEVNTFTLVTKYLNGKYDGENDEVSVAFTIAAVGNYNVEDEDKFDANLILIDEIEKKVKKLEGKININQYNLLNNNLKNAKAKYYDLLAINRACDAELKEITSKKERNEIEKSYSDMYDEADAYLKYLLIELAAAVGVPIECFEKDMIRTYCESIVCDVNNDKYKTLSFKDHINPNGTVNIYK